MPLSLYMGNAFLNKLLRAQAITFPSALYYGLLLDIPDGTATVVEVSSGGGSLYARAQLDPASGAYYTADQLESWNLSTIAWPAPAATWGNVVAVGAFDASTSGNLIFWGPLTPPQTILSTSPAFSLTAAQMAISLGCGCC